MIKSFTHDHEHEASRSRGMDMDRETKNNMNQYLIYFSMIHKIIPMHAYADAIIMQFHILYCTYLILYEFDFSLFTPS